MFNSRSPAAAAAHTRRAAAPPALSSTAACAGGASGSCRCRSSNVTVCKLRPSVKRPSPVATASRSCANSCSTRSPAAPRNPACCASSGAATASPRAWAARKTARARAHCSSNGDCAPPPSWPSGDKDNVRANTAPPKARIHTRYTHTRKNGSAANAPYTNAVVERSTNAAKPHLANPNSTAVRQPATSACQNTTRVLGIA